MLVEGVHFEAPPFELREVGAKALAVALSDLAAMGAAPGEAYVQLGAPADRGDAELLELATGHRRRSPPSTRSWSPAATLTRGAGHNRGGDRGRLRAERGCVRPPRRARGPATSLAVTGELGGAAAGLLMLRRPELAQALEPSLADALRARQIEPKAADRGRPCSRRRGRDGDDRHQRRTRARRAATSPRRAASRSRSTPRACRSQRASKRGRRRGGRARARRSPSPAGRTTNCWSRCPSVEALARTRALGLTPIGRVEAGEGVRLSGPDGPIPVPGAFDQRRTWPGRPDSA